MCPVLAWTWKSWEENSSRIPLSHWHCHTCPFPWSLTKKKLTRTERDHMAPPLCVCVSVCVCEGKMVFHWKTYLLRVHHPRNGLVSGHVWYIRCVPFSWTWTSADTARAEFGQCWQVKWRGWWILRIFPLKCHRNWSECDAFVENRCRILLSWNLNQTHFQTRCE